MNTESITLIDADLLFDAKAVLGEGSFWNYNDQRLWWVDIEGKQLHVFDPKNEEDRVIYVGQRIGTVVPANRGGAIVALQNGIHYLDLKTESLKLISNPLENIPNIRFNDGKCDPAGRFWVGSMELDTKEKAASLYRLNEDGSVDTVLENVTISNGINWSLDFKTMYYIDTPTQRVVAFDYDIGTGSIENRRTVVEIPEGMGSPDGMTIDENGNLWVALYGGYGVGQWDPRTGKMLAKVEVPAPNVTSCAFGGENLDTLFITTAREGMDSDALEKYPGSGGLFSVNPGVVGVPLHLFAGRVPQ